MLDTAQTAGVLRIDVEEFKIDILAFTGHKGLLGPQGTGGIYLRPGIDIKPLKEGGTGSFSEYLEYPDFCRITWKALYWRPSEKQVLIQW